MELAPGLERGWGDPRGRGRSRGTRAAGRATPSPSPLPCVSSGSAVRMRSTQRVGSAPRPRCWPLPGRDVGAPAGGGGWGAWPLSRCPDQTAAVRDGAAARAQAGCLVPGGAGGSSCGSRRGAARAPPGRPLASNLSPSSAAGRPRGVPDAAERLVPVPLGVPARQPAPFLPGLLAECECLSASGRCPVWLGALVPVPAEGRGGSGRLATCLGRGQSVAERLGDPWLLPEPLPGQGRTAGGGTAVLIPRPSSPTLPGRALGSPTGPRRLARAQRGS